MLLYSFVDIKRAGQIVDLGAGSGIVGLLLARKYADAHVALVELQESLFRLAKKNIKLNGLEERVEAFRLDLREAPGPLASAFDLAVSNPPFRKPSTGLLSKGEERAVARHEIKLDLKALLTFTVQVLKPRGRLCLIYHPLRLAELIEELRAVGLEPKRLRFVHGNREAEAKMVLVGASKGGRAGIKVERPLFVHDAAGGYSGELRAIFG